MRIQKCSALDPAFTPVPFAQKDSTALQAEVKHCSTAWLCTAVTPQLHLSQPPTSPRSSSCALGQELSEWHLPHTCWTLSQAQGAEPGMTSSVIAQNRAVPQPREPSRNFCSLLLFFCSSPHYCFSFLSPTSLLLPLCSPPLHGLSAPPSPALLQCTGLQSQLSQP